MNYIKPNKQLETFSKNLAKELLEKQLKHINGQWEGIDFSAIIEARVYELLKANKITLDINNLK